MSHLRLRDVMFRYGPHPPVLQQVSFEVTPGSSALVLGDNGSGKSTLGRLIGGLADATAGTLTIGDRPIARLPSRARSRQTIYLSQVSYLQFFRATIAEEIDLAVAQAGHPSPGATTRQALSVPDLDRNPRDLTYPEMWRLQLFLLGEIFRPEVLFIDEIVAPGIPAQQTALAHLLRARREEGRITLLAYQRPIGVDFDRVFTVASTRVSEGETPSE